MLRSPVTSSFLMRYGTPILGRGLVERLMKSPSYHLAEDSRNRPRRGTVTEEL